MYGRDFAEEVRGIVSALNSTSCKRGARHLRTFYWIRSPLYIYIYRLKLETTALLRFGKYRRNSSPKDFRTLGNLERKFILPQSLEGYIFSSRLRYHVNAERVHSTPRPVLL